MGELGMIFVGGAIGLAAWSLYPGRQALRPAQMTAAGAAGGLIAGMAGQITLFAKDGSISSIAGVLLGALATATAWALIRPRIGR